MGDGDGDGHPQAFETSPGVGEGGGDVDDNEMGVAFRLNFFLGGCWLRVDSSVDVLSLFRGLFLRFDLRVTIGSPCGDSDRFRTSANTVTLGGEYRSGSFGCSHREHSSPGVSGVGPGPKRASS